MTTTPALLALDFDGVICDGLIEYFQTAWTAYCEIWQPDTATPPIDLADRFYPLRPVVETGWEMPVLLRALMLGTSAADILTDWPRIAQQLVQTEQLDKAKLVGAVDGSRDRWIAADEEGWLAQHRFYPGVIDQLKTWLDRDDLNVRIVTTKEGRFVRRLLRQQDVPIADAAIWGKEVKQPKFQTLRDLREQLNFSASDPIWFVEDRLGALELVQPQADLAAVSLFLADWGYNIDRDRQYAQASDRLHLLSLSQFCGEFAQWM